MVLRTVRGAVRPGAARGRRGITSVLAMLYLVIFAALALGFYATTNVSAQISANERRGNEAQQAAESGVHFLRYHLSAVNVPGNLTPEQTFEQLYTQLAARLHGKGSMGGKTLGYRATTAGVPGEIRIPDSPADSIALTPSGVGFRAVITDGSPSLTVKFVGKVRGSPAARAVKITFQRAPKPYVLVGVNHVTLSGSAYTDSYDASKGVYDPATARAGGSIGSNGNIKITDYVKVNGDARYGTAPASLTLAATSSINGMAAPVTSPIHYPSVTLPAAGTYTSLGDVNRSGGTVNYPGGTYVIDSLTLSGTASSPTIITWQGPVTIYIRNGYSVTGNVTINTFENNPKNRKLFFLPTCTTATWSGTNVCVGDLYAPDTDFTVSGSVVKMGRIIAKGITNSSSGGMHYDESLPAPTNVVSYAPDPKTYLEVAP